MSLNSMSYNNHVEAQHKKSMSLNRREDDIPRAPSSGLGSILGTGTPHSSRRSITSDYDTSSILDSASMYGGEEPSSSSPPIRSQVQQQQQREVYVGDDLPPRSNSTRKKSKEPSPSTTLPTIVTPKTTNNSPPLRSTDHNRSFSVTGDDIEAAFDAINDYKTSNNESKDYDNSAHDSLFGLSTIKEATDTDEVTLGINSPITHTDEEMDEIDFDNCFNKYKQKNQTKVIEEKPPKASAPSTPVHQKTSKPSETKSVRHSNETKRPAPVQTEEIRTPLASIPTPNVTPSSLKLKDTIENDPNDSGDEDVDELLGKLERMSSIRSSVKRKIQPKDDIMQQSFSEVNLFSISLAFFIKTTHLSVFFPTVIKMSY
ncbi:hypothetical protein I4U23_028075 [Adineta vaga]|nr:hypothetical protein I4U23_028075 [Adineta vaga]